MAETSHSTFVTGRLARVWASVRGRLNEVHGRTNKNLFVVQFVCGAVAVGPGSQTGSASEAGEDRHGSKRGESVERGGEYRATVDTRMIAHKQVARGETESRITRVGRWRWRRATDSVVCVREPDQTRDRDGEGSDECESETRRRTRRQQR